jgi:type I restriction enzyme M protein
MDASQYKDYVLILLFIKYVSDRYAGDPNALIVVPEGGSFADLVALKGKSDIGDKINVIIAKLAEANGLKGVIDVADFNDSDKLGKGKDMVDRLSNLVALFNNPNLDFRNNRAGGDDLLGDAYEYLMKNFATESGKSKGQFYTPAEVSRIMAKVIGVGSATSAKQTIYDPTCGSGSLLLKAFDEARHLTHLSLSLYGQENDNATAALAKMNMILHDAPEAEIWKDNTLSAPHWKGNNGGLLTHDFVVANPPFSTKAWSNGIDPLNDPYRRFEYGIPPEKNGDYAFLLHVLACLKPTGKGAIILPHGVLFRGGAEAAIRATILKQGYIKGIIGLPANLFYGTGIPACIIILDKEGSVGRKGVFLIDASKGFIKDGPKNRLRAQDIHKIVDTFNKGIEIDRYSRLVPLSEIEANDFNLNIPRYIDSSESEDLQDIDAHLRGGIPNRDIDALDAYWQVFPGLRNALFAPGDRPGYTALKPALADLKETIFDHPEFTSFNQGITALFAEWRQKVHAQLANQKEGVQPKLLIGELSEDILATFRKARLIDAYDVYQHLLNYWDATMQDDAYQISQIGWQPTVESGPNTELLPAEIVIATFFKTEAEAIEALETERDEVSRKIEEICEEHGGEEGLLAEAGTEKGTYTKVSVKARWSTIKKDKDAAEERKLLEDLLELFEQEAGAKKKVKEAQNKLDGQVTVKYFHLDEAALKDLVIEKKWLATLGTDVQTELDRLTQALSTRIKILAERYLTPLPALEKELAALSATVEGHLKTMGFA